MVTDITPVPGAAEPAPALTDERLAELIVERAYREEDLRRRAPLPRWVAPSMRALPKVLAIVTIANGLLGALAVVAPLLRTALGRTATNWIYAAFSIICPQRDSHTWFIGGEPMAMEQRMVAMYLVAGLAGGLYVVWSRLRRPLPTWAMLLGVAPVIIDVAISTADIRPSTPLSRLWTGSLSAFILVWWAYPRFDAQLRDVQRHVARLRERSASSS